MAASIEAACQTDLQAIVIAAQLQGIADANVKVRVMPKVGETLDVTPCVMICPAGSLRPNKTTPFGFEGAVTNDYFEEIIIVKGFSGNYATNGDNAQVQYWHEQVVKAVQFQTGTGDFRTTLPSAPTVYYLNVDSAPSFDRDLLNTGKYIYMVVEVQIKSSEISTSG